ncbi:hypothetical protein HDU98_010545 [Podochytrium sp. JEL0797]|nr:hypothetical protein HDU98_010545 [Podochytrium sp. JEL0797]
MTQSIPPPSRSLSIPTTSEPTPPYPAPSSLPTHHHHPVVSQQSTPLLRLARQPTFLPSPVSDDTTTTDVVARSESFPVCNNEPEDDPPTDFLPPPYSIFDGEEEPAAPSPELIDAEIILETDEVLARRLHELEVEEVEERERMRRDLGSILGVRVVRQEDGVSDEVMARLLQREEEEEVERRQWRAREPEEVGFVVREPVVGDAKKMIGEPYHNFGFAEEVGVVENRFEGGGVVRDLDVCLWGKDCFTIMEGTNQLFYVNLLGTATIVHKWCLQSNDWRGNTLFIIEENRRGMSFTVWDQKSFEKTKCSRNRPDPSARLLLSPEKLEWKDDKLHVVSEKGFSFSMAKKQQEHVDLLAHVLRIEKEGGLTRFRLRIGGKGVQRVEFVVASFVGWKLLDRKG